MQICISSTSFISNELTREYVTGQTLIWKNIDLKQVVLLFHQFCKFAVAWLHPDLGVSQIVKRCLHLIWYVYS